MLSCCLWWHCLVFFLWLCRGKVDVETSQSRVSKAFLEFSLKKTSPGRWSGLTQPHIPGRYSRYCIYPSLILPCSANWIWNIFWQIYSILLCVCSVMDYRWTQNMVWTKTWHTGYICLCHPCSNHVLMFTVIYVL